MIHDSQDSFIQHWALSTSCNFDPDDEDVLELVDLTSAELRTKIESIKSQRRRSRSRTNNRPMNCPFCPANLERSTEAFETHLTGSSCNIDSIDQIPENRPSEIPVDIWWELKDRVGIQGLYETNRRRHYARNGVERERDDTYTQVEPSREPRTEDSVAEGQSLTDKILAFLRR